MTSVLGVPISAGQDVSPGSDPEFKSTTIEFTEYCHVATPGVPAASKSRLFVKADGSLYILNSAGLEEKVSGGAGSVSGWNFSTITTMSDPGSGSVRFNTATPATTTAIAISITNANGNNLRTILQTMQMGDSIYFADAAQANTKLFTITDTTDNTGWFQFDCTLEDQSNVANYIDAELLETVLYPSSDPFDQSLNTTDAVQFADVSLPLVASKPPADSGTLRLYADSGDGKVHAIDQVGTEQILGGVQWRGTYDQTTHYRDDMSIQDDWLMIANTTTDDPPAPQSIGEPFNIYDSDNLATQSQSAKSIITGQRYVATAGSFLTGYRVYTVIGNTYSIYLVLEPTTTKQIRELIRFTATSAGWQSFNLSGIIGEALEVDVIALIFEPDPAPTVTNANYNYVITVNNTIPATGQITHSNKTLNALFVHKTDNDTTDRSALLASLTAGDIVGVGDIRWSIQSTVDNGTYYVIYVSPATQWGTQGVQQFGFEQVAAVPITYHDDVDYWLSNPNISGVISLTGDYDTATINNTQYGIDLEVQRATISPDWDFMAYSGSASALGGGTSTSLANWAQYSDTQYNTGNRLTVTGGTTVTMPNNAGSVINSYMPAGVAFYDGGTQKITPQSVGETYEIRINFSANSSTVNNYVLLDIDIGNGTPIIIAEDTIPLPRGSGVDHLFTTTIATYALTTFITNGATVKITPDDTVDIWDVSYVIIRTAGGNIDIPDAPSDGTIYGRQNSAWVAASGSNLTLQQAYDNGRTITTAAGQPLELKAATADTDQVLEVKDQAGTSTTLALSGQGHIKMDTAKFNTIITSNDILVDGGSSGIYNTVIGWDITPNGLINAARNVFVGAAIGDSVVGSSAGGSNVIIGSSGCGDLTSLPSGSIYIGASTMNGQTTASDSVVCIGDASQATADDSVAIGSFARAAHQYSIAIGKVAVSTDARQFIVGSGNDLVDSVLSWVPAHSGSCDIGTDTLRFKNANLNEKVILHQSPYHISLEAPPSGLVADVDLVLPTTAGTTGQVLESVDGTGTLGWQTITPYVNPSDNWGSIQRQNTSGLVSTGLSFASSSSNALWGSTDNKFNGAIVSGSTVSGFPTLRIEDAGDYKFSYHGTFGFVNAVTVKFEVVGSTGIIYYSHIWAGLGGIGFDQPAKEFVSFENIVTLPQAASRDYYIRLTANNGGNWYQGSYNFNVVKMA